MARGYERVPRVSLPRRGSTRLSLTVSEQLRLDRLLLRAELDERVSSRLCTSIPVHITCEDQGRDMRKKGIQFVADSCSCAHMS